MSDPSEVLGRRILAALVDVILVSGRRGQRLGDMVGRTKVVAI